uniref:PWI domain-containing protein n=1 Tax=Globisporangium ultimum (strain ATCC 200006 / CBS 805.95 / DAOM BR144) TaxID=431595 RepID=K3WPJ3_GLOUD
MASGGFFRGTSIDQDSRYFNQNKKLLAKMSFPKCFDDKVDLKKVKLEVIHQWVTERITALLGFEDDIVVSLVINLLEPKVDEKLDPRHLQISLTGFLEKDAPAFTEELWNLLLSAQAHATGIPTQLLEKKKQELEQLASEKEKLRQVLDKKRQETATNVRRDDNRGSGSTASTNTAAVAPSSSKPDQFGRDRNSRRDRTRGRSRSRSPRHRSPSPYRRRDRRSRRSPSPSRSKSRSRSYDRRRRSKRSRSHFRDRRSSRPSRDDAKRSRDDKSPSRDEKKESRNKRKKSSRSDRNRRSYSSSRSQSS